MIVDLLITEGYWGYVLNLQSLSFNELHVGLHTVLVRCKACSSESWRTLRRILNVACWLVTAPIKIKLFWVRPINNWRTLASTIPKFSRAVRHGW